MTKSSVRGFNALLAIFLACAFTTCSTDSSEQTNQTDEPVIPTAYAPIEPWLRTAVETDQIDYSTPTAAILEPGTLTMSAAAKENVVNLLSENMPLAAFFNTLFSLINVGMRQISPPPAPSPFSLSPSRLFATPIAKTNPMTLDVLQVFRLLGAPLPYFAPNRSPYGITLSAANTCASGSGEITVPDEFGSKELTPGLIENMARKGFEVKLSFGNCQLADAEGSTGIGGTLNGKASFGVKLSGDPTTGQVILANLGCEGFTYTRNAGSGDTDLGCDGLFLFQNTTTLGHDSLLTYDMIFNMKSFTITDHADAYVVDGAVEAKFEGTASSTGFYDICYLISQLMVQQGSQELNCSDFSDYASYVGIVGGLPDIWKSLTFSVVIDSAFNDRGTPHRFLEGIKVGQEIDPVSLPAQTRRFAMYPFAAKEKGYYALAITDDQLFETPANISAKFFGSDGSVTVEGIYDGFGLLSGLGGPPYYGYGAIGWKGPALWAASPVAAPTNFFAQPHDSTTIRLLWLNTSSTHISRIQIDRCSSADCSTIDATFEIYEGSNDFQQRSYYDQFLVANTQYWYRASAFNALGERSQYSQTATATTLP